MINEDVVKLLMKLRDDIDAQKDWGGYDKDDSTDFNEGIVSAMNVVEHYIHQYDKTPNDLKKEMGLYHQ